MTKKPIPSKRADGTLNDLCAALHLQKRRVSTLLRQGMPDSVEGALVWRQSRAAEISVEDLRRSRKALLDLQAERARVDLAARRGELVPASESFKSGMALGFELKQALTKFMAEVVPQLEGLSCVDMYKVLKSGLHKILLSMSSNTAFTSPELEKLIAEFEAARPEPWTPIKPTIK